MVRKLFVLLLVAATASANEVSFRSLQSGWRSSATPLTDRGLNGAGQIVAVLDTGVDYDSCYFAEADGYVDCPIYDRYALPAGMSFAGPAVVEEFDSTTVVHPGFAVTVDATGNLIIERE